MSRLRSTAIATTIALAALALSACGTAEDAPSGSPSASSVALPTPTPTPTPTKPTPPASAPPQAPAVAIPKDCRSLVNAQTYAATFGNTPLNDPAVIDPADAGAVQPSTPPAGATAAQILKSAIQLHCVWRDPGADITYLEATVATVDAAVAKQYLDSLPASGYTCKNASSGRQCQRVQPDPQYPVDDATTSYLRDSVYIFVGQANFPTKNLMGSIVATIWG
jgi:hypothetical protein